MPLRLYADECIDARIVAGLRRRGVDIVAAVDEHLLGKAFEKIDIERAHQLKRETMEEHEADMRANEITDLIAFLPSLDTTTVTSRRPLSVDVACQIELIWRAALLEVRAEEDQPSGCFHCPVYSFSAAMSGFFMSGKTEMPPITSRMGTLVKMGLALGVYAAAGEDDIGAERQLKDQIHVTAKALGADIRIPDPESWSSLPPACYEARLALRRRSLEGR